MTLDKTQFSCLAQHMVPRLVYKCINRQYVHRSNSICQCQKAKFPRHQRKYSHMLAFHSLVVSPRLAMMITALLPSLGALDLLGHCKLGKISFETFLSAHIIDVQHHAANGNSYPVTINQEWIPVDHHTEMTTFPLSVVLGFIALGAVTHIIIVYLIKLRCSRSFRADRGLNCQEARALSQLFDHYSHPSGLG